MESLQEKNPDSEKNAKTEDRDENDGVQHSELDKKQKSERESIEDYLFQLEKLDNNTKKRKYLAPLAVLLDKIVFIIMLVVSVFYTHSNEATSFGIWIALAADMIMIEICYLCLREWEKSVREIGTSYESLQLLFSKEIENYLQNNKQVPELRNEARKLIAMNPRPNVYPFAFTQFFFSFVGLSTVFITVFTFSPENPLPLFDLLIITVGAGFCSLQYDSILSISLLNSEMFDVKDSTVV